jgi:transcriptional regulator with XRE-family HTH domain
MNKKPDKSSDPKKDDRAMLGDRLREAREYLGFSQEEIAAHMGLPRSALSMMETGQRKVEALELKKLAAVYKRPVGYFTGEEIDEPFGAGVKHLARKMSELSPDDREELSRFADFLRIRKQGKEG